MDLAAAIANDGRKFDNTETVVHVSANASGDVRTTVLYVLAETIGEREVGGGFQSNDTIFHMPVSSVTNRPKPEDRIIRNEHTSAEEVWRIIGDVRLETLETRWRCVARRERD